MTLLTAPVAKPLTGVVVGLSISPVSSGGARSDESEVGQVTTQLARALLDQGGSLILGHDWRQGGVMWDVLRGVSGGGLRSSQHQRGADLPGKPAPRRLQNFIPWPDGLPLDQPQREQLADVLSIESAGLPARLEKPGAQRLLESEPEAKTYFRARGLTHMRRVMAHACRARICLGGRTDGSSGRYPGIIEEAYLAALAGVPLYFSRLLGGAAAHLVDAIEQEPMPAEFAATRDDVKAAFGKFGPRLERDEPDARIDRKEVWKCFHDLKVAALSDANGLSVKENRTLFAARNVSDIRQWVLLGLSRLRNKRKI